MGETSRGNGVGVDNRGTTTGNHGPDSALRIKNSELEGSTGRGVEFLDVSLFLGQVTTERSGPDHGRSAVSLDSSGTASSGRDVTSHSPHRTTEEVSSLIKLGSHVEILDLGRLAINSIETDKRVDLKVGDLEIIVSCVLECVGSCALTVQVNVNTVKPDQEVTENILLGRGDVGEKGANDGLTSRELLPNSDEQLERLGVNISNVHTTLAA